LNGGVNTYGYVSGKPLAYVDAMGLANSGPWPRPNPGPGNGSDYWGWDAHIGYGVGRTSFSCTDCSGKKHTYIYKKVCIGAGLGLGASGGDVFGTQGKNCKPENYAGWFAEGGLSAGPISFGVDVGFNEDGPPIPFTSHRLPGSASGVGEGGIGLGAGAMGKLTYCYYTLVGGQ